MTLLAVPGVVGTWFLLAPLAYAAEESPPTVAFTVAGSPPTGSPPTVCVSRPNVTNLAVPEGTAVMLANETGFDAAVTVGGTPVLAVPPGDGALLLLAAGQHEVRMVPECARVAAAVPLVVNVTAPGSASPPDAPSTTSSGTSPSARAGQSSGGSSTSGSDGPGDPLSPTEAPADVVVVTGATANPSHAVIGVPPEVLSVSPIDLNAPLVDPKEVRLVGAIAVICVLGVTAAIIRSIVRLNA